MWRAFLLLISVCFVVIGVFFVHGYEIDGVGVSPEVIKKSVIYFEKGFHGAQVQVNNEPHTSLIDGEIRVTPGFYTVQFDRPGYVSWSKMVFVDDNEVKRFKEVIMLPAHFAPFVLKNDDSRAIAPAPAKSDSTIIGFPVESIIREVSSRTYDAFLFTTPTQSQPKLVIQDTDGSVALIRNANAVYLDEDNAWIVEGNTITELDLPTGQRLFSASVVDEQIIWLNRVGDTNHFLFLNNKGIVSFCDEDRENCHTVAENAVEVFSTDTDDARFTAITKLGQALELNFSAAL